MPDRAQRRSFSTSFEEMLPHGAGATGFRLRLTRGLPAGFVASRHETTGKLLPESPVLNQR
jgi:hypothetical protein